MRIGRGVCDEKQKDISEQASIFIKKFFRDSSSRILEILPKAFSVGKRQRDESEPDNEDYSPRIR